MSPITKPQTARGEVTVAKPHRQSQPETQADRGETFAELFDRSRNPDGPRSIPLSRLVELWAFGAPGADPHSSLAAVRRLIYDGKYRITFGVGHSQHDEMTTSEARKIVTAEGHSRLATIALATKRRRRRDELAACEARLAALPSTRIGALLEAARSDKRRALQVEFDRALARYATGSDDQAGTVASLADTLGISDQSIVSRLKHLEAVLTCEAQFDTEANANRRHGFASQMRSYADKAPSYFDGADPPRLLRS